MRETFPLYRSTTGFSAFSHPSAVWTLPGRSAQRARGKRLVAGVPYGHGKTSTFVDALGCDGIEAPCVFDGPINSARFLAYAGWQPNGFFGVKFNLKNMDLQVV